MGKTKDEMKESFLVRGWVMTLNALEKVSLFYILSKFVFVSKPQVDPELEKKRIEKRRRFVDSWLVFHTLLALSFIFVSNNDNVSVLIKYLFVIYGSLRIFEILIYQLNVMLVHPYKGNVDYSLISYRRMTIALIHNFFEIVFWFAGTYITFQFIQGITPVNAIYQSFTHMVTYNLDIDKNKWSYITLIVLQSQALMGVFMTVISLSRFISLFLQPKSMNKQESNEYSSRKAEELKDIKQELKEIKRLILEKTKQ